jgi:hypothetical protein
MGKLENFDLFSGRSSLQFKTLPKHQVLCFQKLGFLVWFEEVFTVVNVNVLGTAGFVGGVSSGGSISRLRFPIEGSCVSLLL